MTFKWLNNLSTFDTITNQYLLTIQCLLVLHKEREVTIQQKSKHISVYVKLAL